MWCAKNTQVGSHSTNKACYASRPPHELNLHTWKLTHAVLYLYYTNTLWIVEYWWKWYDAKIFLEHKKMKTLLFVIICWWVWRATHTNTNTTHNGARGTTPTVRCLMAMRCEKRMGELCGRCTRACTTRTPSGAPGSLSWAITPCSRFRFLPFSFSFSHEKRRRTTTPHLCVCVSCIMQFDVGVNWFLSVCMSNRDSLTGGQ